MKIGFRAFKKERQEAYTRLLMRYLAAHGFATAKILQSFFGLADISSVRTKLSGWKKQDLIDEFELPNPLGGRAAKLYRLSQNGLGFARGWGLEPKEGFNVSLPNIEHALFLQRMQIALTKRGYFGFGVENAVKDAKERFGHVPDVVCRNKFGKVCVFEAERSIKSKSRYQQIFSNLALSHRRGFLDAVFYVTPDETTKRALLATLRAALGKNFQRKGFEVSLSLEEIEKFLKVVTVGELEETSGRLMRFAGFEGGETGLDSVCLVHFAGLVKIGSDTKKAVIVESLGENRWTSTTNAIESVARQALELLNEEQPLKNGDRWRPEEVAFFEFWDGKQSLTDEEMFLYVWFEAPPFDSPQWSGRVVGELRESLKNWLF
jgi:hypothetical protein